MLGTIPEKCKRKTDGIILKSKGEAFGIVHRDQSKDWHRINVFSGRVGPALPVLQCQHSGFHGVA